MHNGDSVASVADPFSIGTVGTDKSKVMQRGKLIKFSRQVIPFRSRHPFGPKAFSGFSLSLLKLLVARERQQFAMECVFVTEAA